MARRIDTVEARSRLPARNTPYWTRLFEGCSLGYRKLTPSSAGTWIARIYDPATGKETWRTLGSFEELQPHDRYRAAKRGAEDLCDHMARGGVAESSTVAMACDAYVQHLRDETKGASADDAQARFKRWVHGTKLAGIELRKLSPVHLRTWRQQLLKTPVVVNPHADAADQRQRERSPASANRDMTALRAALNLALESGAVTSDAAWRVPLRPIDNADRRRELYLDRTQRAALIAHAAPDVATFLRGLALVPLRPGALASLAAGSFNARLAVLVIGQDKAGAERRIKLPPATAEMFAALAADKLADAPLFCRAEGKAWDKDAWKKPVKAAASAAGLPPNTTAYTLRHSVITDLITEGLDVLTVARLSGTSVAMIERHYGHLRADHAATALAKLAL